MTSIISLPNEILSFVVQDLKSIADVSSFSRSCRSLHDVVTPYLYRVVRDDPAILCWAIDEGRIGTVRRLLLAGADPNTALLTPHTRSTTLRVLHPTLHQGHRAVTEDTTLPDRHSNATEAEAYVDIAEPPLESDNIYDDGLSDAEDENPAIWGDRDDPFDDDDSLGQQCYWTPLHVAARWGHNGIIDLLLQHGANLEPLSRGFCDCTFPSYLLRQIPGLNRQNPLWTPLHTAICHGNDSTARLLISRGASTDVSTRYIGSDPRRVTALHSACGSDLASLARYLVERGIQADVHVEDHQGHTPMTYAYFAGSWAAIDFLMENGASLNTRLGPSSIFEHACWAGRFAEALRFIDLGVEVRDSSVLDDSLGPIIHRCCLPPQLNRPALFPLREADQGPYRSEVIRLLVKAGASLDTRDDTSHTPLMIAASSHSVQLVELLLSLGASAVERKGKDETCETALSLACAAPLLSPDGSLIRIVRVLLAHMPGRGDHGALMALCRSLDHCRDKADVARLLIGKPDSIAPDLGARLFSCAVEANNFDICNVLLESVVEYPNLAKLKTLVYKACKRDDAAAIEYLGKLSGASGVIRQDSIVYETLMRRYSKAASALIQAGAPFQGRYPGGVTCLMAASSLPSCVPAKLLLERGADPNIYDDRGDCALSLAVRYGQVDVIKLLLDHGANIRHPDSRGAVRDLQGDPITFAIRGARLSALQEILDHPSYQNLSQEIRDDYLRSACMVAANDRAAVMDVVLRSGGVNPDAVIESGNAWVTPLHLCLASEDEDAVEILLENLANPHKVLEPPETATSEEFLDLFEDSTPLEWAIDNSPLPMIRAILNFSDLGGDPADDDEPPVPLERYARAVCRRHKPEVLHFVITAGLDPEICDEDGNCLLSMLCDTIDKIWPFEDPNWPMERILERSAACVVKLLGLGVNQHHGNQEGVSAFDHLRRMLTYQGASEFHTTLAEIWGSALAVSGSLVGVKASYLCDNELEGASTVTTVVGL
ncbi:ankyrin [Xylariomycetidae sp. FL2044]|nr:ankyrin [Xylariomycetidae sp. FL2044]